MALDTRTSATGVFAEENSAKREELVEMLKKAYWMEIETVMNYIANTINPDGVRAQEIVEILARTSRRSSVTPAVRDAHQGALRRRARQHGFTAEQTYLQPPEQQTDIVHVIRGVIEAETGAIQYYQRIIEFCDGFDSGDPGHGRSTSSATSRGTCGCSRASCASTRWRGGPRVRLGTRLGPRFLGSPSGEGSLSALRRISSLTPPPAGGPVVPPAGSPLCGVGSVHKDRRAPFRGPDG